MTKLINSSTGGFIRVIPTGLVHTAGDQAYSGYLAEAGLEAKVYDAPKRGRGRPSKVSQSGAPYDFSAFGRVKVPVWTGDRRVYTKDSA